MDDPIYTDTPDERLRELGAQTKADVILCGHTHQQFVREVNHQIYINPGSVGKPIDGDPRAGYCVLNIKKGSMTINHYRIEYDLEKTLAAMRQAGLAALFTRSLELSLGFDKVQAMLEETKPEVS